MLSNYMKEIKTNYFLFLIFSVVLYVSTPLYLIYKGLNRDASSVPIFILVLLYMPCTFIVIRRISLQIKNRVSFTVLQLIVIICLSISLIALVLGIYIPEHIKNISLENHSKRSIGIIVEIERQSQFRGIYYKYIVNDIEYSGSFDKLPDVNGNKKLVYDLFSIGDTVPIIYAIKYPQTSKVVDLILKEE